MPKQELIINKSLINNEDENLLLQVRDEHDRWQFAMVNVVKELESDYKLYRSQKKKSAKQKIGDWTVFSTHSALMARSYITRPESVFESTDIGEEDKVKNLNNALEQDFNDDDMEIVKYWRDFYKYLFGVGIVVRNWWDWDKIKSTFQNIDPRNMIFDPDGDYPIGQYWFSWFYRNVYKSELEEWGLYNDELNPNDKGNTIMLDAKDQDKMNAWVLTQWPSSVQENSNPLYRIYYHVTHVIDDNWDVKIMLVITGNSNSLILDKQELQSLPFSFSYWRPDGTPTGMRVTSITGDVQRVKAEFANLRLDKSKAELYPMYIRNKRLIPNASDLEFGFNKIIDANPLEGENLNNAITPMQKDFRADNSFVIEQSLDSTVESAVSIGKIAQWSSPERREWVGTNELIAESTDVNLALNAKIESWWEKQLLRLYINGLREDMTEWDVKTVNVLTSYWLVPRDLKKEDFALNENTSIKIITVIEKEKELNKLKIGYGTAIWMIQNLNLSESATKFLYRDYFETLGLTKEKAERIIDYTPDEIEAIINSELLNDGEFIKVRQEYDPMTHLAAIKDVKPGENVDMYRYALMELYKIKWIQTPLKWDNESVENNMAAQSMSTIANESKQQVNL